MTNQRVEEGPNKAGKEQRWQAESCINWEREEKLLKKKRCVTEKSVARIVVLFRRFSL